jgi:hypothetical protein
MVWVYPAPVNVIEDVSLIAVVSASRTTTMSAAVTSPAFRKGFSCAKAGVANRIKSNGKIKETLRALMIHFPSIKDTDSYCSAGIV